MIYGNRSWVLVSPERLSSIGALIAWLFRVPLRASVALVLLCALSAAAQAQEFSYSTSSGAITITVTDLPVTSIGAGRSPAAPA